MDVLNSLILIQFGITIINSIIALYLWLTLKESLYRTILLVWLGALITLLSHGLTSQLSDVGIILGASVEFILNFILAALLANMLVIKINWRLYASILLVGYLGTFLVYFMKPDPPFLMLSLPVRAGTQFPLLHISLSAFMYYGNKMSPSTKGLAVIYMLFFIHTMDYPFLRNNPNFTLAGFTISLLIFFALSIFIPAIAAEIIGKRQLEKERLLKNTFAKFVPHKFLYLLNKNIITDIKFGDHIQKEMSVMFADIRAFTTLSENLTPRENFEFLNSFFSYIGPEIRKHEGFIDKFIGDGFMALFDGNADNAVLAAIETIKKLSVFNSSRINKGRLPIKIGIGINTGELMLGTIGEKDRMEGTVISDAVNLASRVENLTKFYGSSILITDKTYKKLKSPSNYLTRFIDQVLVKGKSEPVKVWEVFNGDELEILKAKVSTIDDFENAVSLFYSQEFHVALINFQKVIKILPKDNVTRMYIQRCEQILKDGVKENWDVFEMKQL